jgi:hypothetical protein
MRRGDDGRARTRVYSREHPGDVSAAGMGWDHRGSGNVCSGLQAVDRHRHANPQRGLRPRTSVNGYGSRLNGMQSLCPDGRSLRPGPSPARRGPPDLTGPARTPAAWRRGRAGSPVRRMPRRPRYRGRRGRRRAGRRRWFRAASPATVQVWVVPRAGHTPGPGHGAQGLGSARGRLPGRRARARTGLSTGHALMPRSIRRSFAKSPNFILGQPGSCFAGCDTPVQMRTRVCGLDCRTARVTPMP